MNTSVESMQYDLSTCYREPIHRLGKIQSNGGLIAVSADWLVIAHSENLSQLAGLENDLLGTQLSEILMPEASSALSKLVNRLEDEDQLERILGVCLFRSGAQFDLSVHFSHELLILEFSPSESEANQSHTDNLRTALRQLTKSTSVEKLCQQAAESVAKMISFERVMIYKFHPDGSGEVVAEHRESDVDSFLGLRYPPFRYPPAGAGTLQADDAKGHSRHRRLRGGDYAARCTNRPLACHTAYCLTHSC